MSCEYPPVKQYNKTWLQSFLIPTYNYTVHNFFFYHFYERIINYNKSIHFIHRWYVTLDLNTVYNNLKEKIILKHKKTIQFFYLLTHYTLIKMKICLQLEKRGTKKKNLQKLSFSFCKKTRAVAPVLVCLLDAGA